MHVQVRSAHIVAVPLRSHPPLLGSLVAVAGRQRRGRCGTVRADGGVLVYDAAERPSRAGILRCRPESPMKRRRLEFRRRMKMSIALQ